MSRSDVLDQRPQVGDQLDDLGIGTTVQDHAEGTLLGVLHDQDDRTSEEVEEARCGYE